VFDPKWIQPSTKMYQDLSTSYQMKAFGLDLSESASQAMNQGIGHALPFLALIAIVAVTGFIQQRQMQGRSPNSQINPQQQMIMKIMPFFLPVISFGLPSGLVLYFAVSNLYRIGQQAFISRSIYGVTGPDGTSSWKHLFGFGLGLKASSKSKSSKAIPAKSRPAPKGAAKSKATASAGAVKGGRTVPAKTSSRGNKGSKTPASSPTRPRSAQPTKPVSGSGAADAPPPMQPRARKKKG